MLHSKVIQLYIYIQSFSYSFPLWFPVGPLCLSTLYVIVCICTSQTPNPSLPDPPFSLATTSLFSIPLQFKLTFCLIAMSYLTLCNWTVPHQAPLSMGFPRQEYWSGLLFPSP